MDNVDHLLVKLASPMNFVAMTKEEIEEYLKEKIKKDATDGAVANAIPFAQAKQIIDDCLKIELPDGPLAPGNYWWRIESEVNLKTQRVGGLWIKQMPNGAVMLYGIDILPQFRRRGLAVEAMKLMEEKAREMGANRIRLHVYPTNLPAWKLYVRADFRPVSLYMEKLIG